MNTKLQVKKNNFFLLLHFEISSSSSKYNDADVSGECINEVKDFELYIYENKAIESLRLVLQIRSNENRKIFSFPSISFIVVSLRGSFDVDFIKLGTFLTY